MEGLGLRVSGLVEGSGFRVLGVSSTGCAGAESAQAYTLNRMMPPPQALHPCSNFVGFWFP